MKRIAPKQKILNGVRLCRRCEKPVPKGRIVYCSALCSEEFAIAYFPSFARDAVFNRDHGICARCGCDTEKLRRILWTVNRIIRSSISRELGFSGWFTSGGFWQADHIHECARGGWGRGLDNFRTLCTPCHKEETARLARELAEQRREKRAAGGLFREEVAA